MGIPNEFSVDIEPTNRCNADCYFCPRDQTPHQGLMSAETFDRSLDRVVELRDHARDRIEQEIRVSLCGLGEPLLNPATPSFVAKVRSQGLHCSISSNGSTLDERRANLVLDAGLQGIDINVGEIGQGYDDIYKLPWERTFANVVRFAELAGDQCEVRIILVDHRGDPEHLAMVKAFWREAGMDAFFTFPLINRAGALHVPEMDYVDGVAVTRAAEIVAEADTSLLCTLPFASMVIGYDGVYYLCCSDWKKEVGLGTVFDRSLIDVLAPKLAITEGRRSLCAQCSLDPQNRVVDAIRQHETGPQAEFAPRFAVRHLTHDSEQMGEVLERLDPTVRDRSAAERPSRRRIPLTSH